MSLWPDSNNPPNQTGRERIVNESRDYILIQISFSKPNPITGDIIDCGGFGLIYKEDGKKASRTRYWYLGGDASAVSELLRALKIKES